jgi:transposase
MRYELNDCEWGVIKPILPNKPRGIPRVDDSAGVDGEDCRYLRRG